MKKLLVYLKAYRKEACLAPVFKMLEAIFELFVPLVIKGIIDYGIANEDRMYCLRTFAFTSCRNRTCHGNYSTVVLGKSSCRICSKD